MKIVNYRHENEFYNNDNIAPIRILLIADEQDDGGIAYSLLMQLVQTVPFVITTLQQIDVVLNQLDQLSFNLVLLDLSVSDYDEIDFFGMG